MDEEMNELLSSIEEEFNANRLKKQGLFALAAAEIAGAVYTRAVASSVPADLAKEMCVDFWNSAVFPGALIVTEEGED